MAGCHLGWRNRVAKALRAAASRIEQSSLNAKAAQAAWKYRYAAYQLAAKRYEVHDATVYHPALSAFERELERATMGVNATDARKVRSSLYAQHRILQIEEEGDRLIAQYYDALRALIATPAPTTSELAAKLGLLSKWAAEEPFSTAIAIAAFDARSLARQSA